MVSLFYLRRFPSAIASLDSNQTHPEYESLSSGFGRNWGSILPYVSSTEQSFPFVFFGKGAATFLPAGTSDLSLVVFGDFLSSPGYPGPKWPAHALWASIFTPPLCPFKQSQVGGPEPSFPPPLSPVFCKVCGLPIQPEFISKKISGATPDIEKTL